MPMPCCLQNRLWLARALSEFGSHQGLVSVFFSSVLVSPGALISWLALRARLRWYTSPACFKTIDGEAEGNLVDPADGVAASPRPAISSRTCGTMYLARTCNML